MSVSRRGFLASLAAGAAGTAVAGSASAGSARHFAGHAGRYGLLHDTTLCVGCRSCEFACTEVNQLKPPAAPVGDKAVFDQVRRVTPDALTVVNRYTDPGSGQQVFRKHQCMHCNEPCCASVCLVRAFTKTPEGPVLYDPEVCMGCRYCVTACPYDALSYEYDEPLTPRVRRCTMCYDRIRDNKQPGCAEACPTGAITFGRRDELLRVAAERMRKNPGTYFDHVFGELEFGGTSWLTLAGVRPGVLGLHEDATWTSLPEIGTAFLQVVPLVITIYPGLLAGFYAFSKRKEQLSHKEVTAAVTEALMQADEDTKKKLAEAATRAGKDKDKAIATAVKKALEEAAAKAKEAGQ
ncbi:MAG: 4Fe-4S dicluster domain-containing protein [Pseudomonadota bacterium]